MSNRIDYLLTCLSEECNETAQRATKAIRFGLGEVQSGQTLTNAERLVYEFNDLFALMEVLQAEGAIDKIIDMEAIDKKKKKIERWYQYHLEQKRKQMDEVTYDYSFEPDKSIIYNKTTDKDLCMYFSEEDKEFLLNLLNSQK